MAIESVTGGSLSITYDEKITGYIYDSLTFIEFLVILEESIDVEIPIELCNQENFRSISSINDVILLLKQK